MSISYDPFNRFDELRDRLVSGGRAPLSFPMDAYRRGDAFLVHLDLPGVQPDTVDITVENPGSDSHHRATLRTARGRPVLGQRASAGQLQPPTPARLDDRHREHRRQL